MSHPNPPEPGQPQFQPPLRDYQIPPPPWVQGEDGAFRTHVFPPPQPPKKKDHTLLIVCAILGSVLLVLVLLGSCVASLGTPSSKPNSPPAPAATVTATAPATVVEKTPQSCLDALDYADQGFGIAAKVIGYMEPAIRAVFSMDTAKIEQITRKINKQTEKIDKVGPKYQAAKAECRASA
jgi:hypothetical protein